MIINRGSEWRKWDLHLHSPYTIIKGSGSYQGVTEDDFIKKILQEKISVVGLTNYFKFTEEDYKLATKLREKGITTFMNLEFRLTQFNDDKMLSDYHVIFSDELSNEEIDNFLSNLDISVGSSHKKINSLTDKEIRQNAAINFDNLINNLEKESLNLKGKYLTAFLSRGHGNTLCAKNRGTTVYEEVVRKSDLIIHSTDFIETLESDKAYWLGKAESKNKYVKPLLQTSDAHCLDDIGFKIKNVEPKNKVKKGVYKDREQYLIKVPAYTWIKADPSFEGLKQIIYEPDERINYGASNPDTKLNYMVIDYIKYYNSEIIYFNSGMNAIIGGRSTGKSTLLNSIAKFQNNKNFDETKHNTLESNEYEIVWRDGESNSERMVEYIPQDFMVMVSTSRKKLNELLEGIISKRNMDVEEKAYREKIEKIENNINTEIINYMNQLNLLQQQIKPEGDRAAAISSIENIQKNIEKIRLENKFSEDENNNYKTISDSINNISLEIQKLKIEKEQLLEIKSYDFSINIELKQISNENQSLIEGKIENIEKSSEREWVVFIDSIIDRIDKQIKIKNNELKNLNSSEIYSRGKKLESNNEELKQLEEELESHKKVKKEFDEYEKKQIQLSGSLDEKYNSVLAMFEKYYIAIKEFKNNFIIKENDLKIEIKTSILDFEEKIDYLNARNSENNNFIEEFNNNIKDFNPENFKSLLKKWLEDAKLSFNRNKNANDLFKDIVTTNWFNYDYMITYQNDEFGDMSQGKKSFVILKLLLEFSDEKKPVLIDQPEDSLDNRAIYYDLRDYLLKTKSKRQIIVVTHNPNIVVGSDSENIIVAHQDSSLEKNKNGKKFQYINGAIENTKLRDKNCEYVLESQGIREHIFDVLEGGKEAFNKREQKYNY